MEKLSKQDIHYLIALTASEEGMLVEIIWEFNKWSCNKDEVLEIFSSLIKDNTMLVYRLENEESIDLSKEQSLSLVSKWSELDRKDHMLYLTEDGEKRWKTDDWGITTKRARHLMFNNDGVNKNA